jgi:uncharacterized protein with ATP-grasp and redox domains
MPEQTLPPYLMTSTPNSFARHTIVERKPQIIRQVIADNDYPPQVTAALDNLLNEIASQSMQPLQESATDVDFWNTEVAKYTGRTWLEVPWYFAETYFYRKLLEVVGYFQPGERQGLNPFEKQKRGQIAGDIQKLAIEWEQLSALEPETRFEALLHSCLWGNRADLSNFTIMEKGRGGLAAHTERHLILIDHTQEIHKLLSGGVPRVDFICDNVGSDILFDLGLTDFLLTQGWVKEVHLNLKNQPFFVSDAMPADVLLSIDWLKKSPNTATRDWGQRLEENLTERRLILETDPFWATYLSFRRMPTHLRQSLAGSAVVLIKGDVNYRRLLEDRDWPHTTRMEDVCSYFPAPFATLRTLKGEIMVGLEPGQAEELQAADPTWLINGKRGVIQLVTPQEI